MFDWTWPGPTITYVIPWYGPHIPGGAEMACRRSAEELSVRGVPVEVWTTTAGGLSSDWSQPAFAPGCSTVNGVAVRRFAVRPRRAEAFDALNTRLLAGETLSLRDEAVFVREIIGSDTLEQAIVAERAQRIFIFIPYMFGTSYWGAQLARRAFLIPCLHDEAYAYMHLYQLALGAAHGLIFHAPAEERFAHQIGVVGRKPTVCLGVGVETGYTGDAARFRARFGIHAPFVLYAGRRDATKNTPLLFAGFRHYREQGGTLQLVCIGGPGEALPADLVAQGAAHDLGFVGVAEKFDACAAASALCQPSLHESFSIVLMEAWIAGTPALVHSDCTVTREFCAMSGGGLDFRDAEGFSRQLSAIVADAENARRMGAAGRAFVLANYTWDTVLFAPTGVFASCYMTTRIHMMTAALAPGDAIGNYIQSLVPILRDFGFAVSLYADLSNDNYPLAHQFSHSYRPTGDDLLWLHYSIYSDNIRWLRESPISRLSTRRMFARPTSSTAMMPGWRISAHAARLRSIPLRPTSTGRSYIPSMCATI
ncbi:glycosyltransferase family 4 protein [Candidatus Gracilibacteria bacterium]|nr:glycosyltransferase family 4 protein [Candidatus Gracilibacteria bacterium]